MKKYAVLLIGVSLVSAALVTREWLLIEEIAVTQTQLQEQMAQSIEMAQSPDRLRHLSTSAVVFERYLEPIVSIANRLVWPPFRSTAIDDWKRIAHTRLDDLSAARMAALTSEVQKQIEKIKAESKPSVARLNEILKASEDVTATNSCTQIVQSEMKLLKESGEKHDQEILALLKTEGIAQIKNLQKTTKAMSLAQVGEFLKSGKFIREIEQPVLDYVFQIKQEELRRAAWDEFDRKIQETLSKKGIPVAKVKDRTQRAKHEIEKLFNSMAEAKAPPAAVAPALPDSPVVPEPGSKLVYPEPAAPVPHFPSDSAEGMTESYSDLSPSDSMTP